MPQGDSAFPWDVKFTVTGGASYGFMLTSPQGKSKQIAFSEVQPESPYRLNRYNTQSTQDNRDYSAETDTPIAQNDFSGGCGQLELDDGDETKYWWSTGVVTHVNGKVYPAPPATSLALSGATGGVTGVYTYLDSSFNRYDFLWESTNLWRRDAANNSNAWVKVYTASVAITDFKVFNGAGLIAVPTAASTDDYFIQSNVLAAATWTPTTKDATVFSTVLGKPKYWEFTKGTVYAHVDSNKVYFTTDPTIDGWTGPIDTGTSGNIGGRPGDTTYGFVGTNAVNDFIFCRKPDVIESIDSQQDVLEVIWQWRGKPSQYNFKYAGVCADQLLFNAGNEVFSYDPTTGQITRMDIGRQHGFSTKEILGVDGDSRFGYVLAKVRVPTIRSADSVALFRCIKQRSGWNFEVVWEDSSLGSNTYGYMKAVPFGNGTRVYWGQDNASDTKVYSIDFPAEWDESASGSFSTTASLWTSLTRAEFNTFIKKHLYFNLNGLNLNSSNSVAVQFSTDSGASFSTLTTAIDNHTEVSFTNQFSREILFRFDFVSTGSNATTLANYDHHMRVSFHYLPQVQMSIRVGPNIETRNRSLSNLRIDEIWDALVTLRTTDADILFTDFMGNSFNVTVDTISVNPTRHDNPGEYEQEAVIVISRADRGT